MRTLKADVARRAEGFVDELLDRRSFDGITDLARRFPVDVVADLIGLSDDGREDLLNLIDANFNCFGPSNTRTWESASRMQELARVRQHPNNG